MTAQPFTEVDLLVPQALLSEEAVQVERRRFLGGSDAAGIVGLSPWKTPLDVYLLKRGEMPTTGREANPDVAELLAQGREMEPIIINRLVRRFGVKVTKRSTPEKPNRYLDLEHPFLASEVDFEWLVTKEIAEDFSLPVHLIGSIQNGEVKKVHQFATAQFGAAETEEVPVQYAAQAMHGLMITKRQLCMFAVQLGDDLSIYWVWRDEETIANLRAQEVKFWFDHVLAGKPPAVRTLADVYHLFPRTRSITVEANIDTARLFEEMERHKGESRAALAHIEEIKFQIGVFMLGEDAISRNEKGEVKPTAAAAALPAKHVLKWFGSPLLTIAYESASRIDTELLRKRYPDAANDCSKSSSFFVFRTSKEKR